MKENNNNGNDTNVGSMENSIEEDIKCVRDFLEYSQDMINDMDYERPVDVTIYQQEINSMQHILSDYKKLQKENEELKGTLRDTQNSWFEDTKKMEKLKM